MLAPFRCIFVAELPRACAETLPPVVHFFWRCFRRTGASDTVSDDPAALNVAGHFLPSGLWHSLMLFELVDFFIRLSVPLANFWK